MYEQATLKHMVALVPDGGFERPVPGTEWTVRQLFGHLAQALTTYSETLRAWLDGGDPMANWDPDRTNAESAGRYSGASAGELAATFGTGVNALVATLAAVPDERVDDDFGPMSFSDALGPWSGHYLSHAVPLVDALPEVRMDPLVLNWLLDAHFDDDERRAWQDALLTEARAYIATLTFEDEEEDE